VATDRAVPRAGIGAGEGVDGPFGSWKKGEGAGPFVPLAEAYRLWRHLQVMRKPRSVRTDSLRLHRGHRRADARSHDVLHLRAWRLDVKGGD
jgi:hypothetical protein